MKISSWILLALLLAGAAAQAEDPIVIEIEPDASGTGWRLLVAGEDRTPSRDGDRWLIADSPLEDALAAAARSEGREASERRAIIRSTSEVPEASIAVALQALIGPMVRVHDIRLVTGPPEGALEALPPPRDAAVAGWIESLGADDWHEREQATQALLAAGPAVVGRLRSARARQTDPEVARRLEWLLDRIEPKVGAPGEEITIKVSYVEAIDQIIYTVGDRIAGDRTSLGAILPPRPYAGFSEQKVLIRAGKATPYRFIAVVLTVLAERRMVRFTLAAE
jgi:hypothetical protein